MDNKENEQRGQLAFDTMFEGNQEAENAKVEQVPLKKKKTKVNYKDKFKNVNEEDVEETSDFDENANTTIEEDRAFMENKKISISRGLDKNDIRIRKRLNLINKITNYSKVTNGQIIRKNIFTTFNLINLFIAIALVVAGSYKNLLFLPIIIINTIIGIVQEINAKNSIEKLSFVDQPNIVCIRNGHRELVPCDEIYQDDILILEAGKQIIADCIVKKGCIEVNESVINGEPDLIVKKPGSLLHSGSYIVSGECIAKAERVGDECYVQQLAKGAKNYSKPSSEIMNSLSILIRIITVVVIILGAALFLNSYLISENAGDWRACITYTAGSMIGMIPSGLFLMTTISLSVGVIKLAKRKTLTHNLYCIETLARVDVLCLDKTGTITDGSMKVSDVIELDPSYNLKNLVSDCLGNTKEKNPTALALENKFGRNKKITSKYIIPFSSSRKLMAYYDEELKRSVIIGAPEFVLKDFEGSKLESRVNEYASLGFRVIVVAISNEKIKDVDYVFGKTSPIGIIVIEDVIRKDAPETIKTFQENGVAIKVISGDNPITVSKIAQRAGIENAKKYISLDGKTDEEVKQLAFDYCVFGRVDPKQKQILIKALKEKHTVAMTGDGVNDILALKEADCSIAMASGSEAARNVSQLVLMDSNFSSLPDVVNEGRRVINNIKRVASLFLTKTLFSFLLTLVVLIAQKTYPIQSIQLMLYDWFIVSIPSLYLALEQNKNRIKGKFLKDVIFNALPGALLITTSYIIILLFGNASILNFDPSVVSLHQVTSTITSLSIIGIGFLVLLRVCRPFNKGRRIGVIIMLILLLICLFSLNNIFEILSFGKIGSIGTMLFIMIFLLNTHLYRGLVYVFDFIKEKKWMNYIK